MPNQTFESDALERAAQLNEPRTGKGDQDVFGKMTTPLVAGDQAIHSSSGEDGSEPALLR
jgi:hypothetical protein